MAEISEHSSYNIDDLVTVRNSGWKHLERFARLQCQYKLENSGDETKPALERIHLAVKDVLTPYVGIGKHLVPKSLPDCNVIFNLAASSSRTLYQPIRPKTILFRYRLGSWAKDKVKLHKSLQKVTNAFAISDDYEQAFSKIATKNNVKRFKEHWSQQDCNWANGECFSVKIEPCLKKMMHHLEYGLSSKQKCREAWWNCLWLFMEPTIKTMLKIKECINTDSPLSTGQLKILNYYISHGYPITDFSVKDDGKHKIQIILKPNTSKMILNSPFEVMSVILLVQPTFDLSQKLQALFSKSRFTQQCHAPSCGKFFYTQRKAQVVCGSDTSGETSECRKEWFSFMRYLKALNRIPEKDWNNSTLVINFLQRQ